MPKTIQSLGSEFVKQHQWLLDISHQCGVALCGGCAAAVSQGKEGYQPPDLDFVATKESALVFIRLITDFLLERQSHFRIFANSRNDFVPKPAVGHFRIQTSFWVPICIFVLPYEKFRAYRIPGRYLLQFPADVQKAAADLSKVDGKDRYAATLVFDAEVAEEEMSKEEQERDALSCPLNLLDDAPPKMGSERKPNP